MIVLVFDLFVIMFLLSFRRSRAQQAAGGAPAKGPKPISRRSMTRRAGS